MSVKESLLAIFKEKFVGHENKDIQIIHGSHQEAFLAGAYAGLQLGANLGVENRWYEVAEALRGLAKEIDKLSFIWKHHEEETMTPPNLQTVRAWAVIEEDGRIAHHYEGYAIHQFKHQALANFFSDGSDKLVQV